jgi:CheY-like chemotaxis protein
MMTEIDGVEAAIRVRSFLPEYKIVLFSGQAGVDNLLKNARLRGHHFELQVKPIHPSDLLDYLRSLARQFRGTTTLVPCRSIATSSDEVVDARLIPGRQ